MRGIALAIMFAGWTIGMMRIEVNDPAYGNFIGGTTGILGLLAFVCILLGV
jgi:hypothetical protein